SEDNPGSLILSWNKPGRYGLKPEISQDQEADVDQQSDCGEPQQPSNHPDVPIHARFKPFVEEPEKPPKNKVERTGQKIAFSVSRLQQQAGQRWTQGQRVKRGNYRRDGDGESKLAIKLPG